MDADPQALFSELCQRLHVYPDKQGEVYIPCPKCGREKKHFSFALLQENGLHIGGACHACGYHIGARGLMALVGLAPDFIPPPNARPIIARPKQPDAPKGIFKLNISPDGLAARWSLHEEAVARWQAYCPQLTVETIEQRMLGYGVLPPGTSRCMQPRLIVPIFRRDRVVGFRARLDGPSCGKCQGETKCARWLSPLGSRNVLYGEEDVLAAHDLDLLVVCESPVEKLLVDQLAANYIQRIIAVATLGVSNWDDSWGELFRKARRVLIAYDNDPPGNGGASDQLRAQWFSEHPNTSRDLICGGARLASKLLEAGCRDVRLHHWGRHDKAGRDLRDLLANT